MSSQDPVAGPACYSGFVLPNYRTRRPKMTTPSVDHSSQPVPHFEKPVLKSQIVGYYSVDGERTFLPNSSRLMYYNPSNEMTVYTDMGRGVYLDLNEGIDVAVRRNVSFVDKNIDLLLQWIQLNHRKIKAPANSGRWIRPKFVCSRGTLNKLLCSRVLPNETWILYAARWKGTIYLCPDKQYQQEELTEVGQMRFSSWGHKFEQYILSKSPDKLPDTSKPVIETEEFRCVYQRNIGGHSVMFCSVMKGVLSKTPLEEPLPFNKLNFIELKTSRIVENAGHKLTFGRNKIVKWWTQCYLTNIEHVLCGFRDESGVVNKLSLYNVEKIIEEGKPYWKPGGCVNVCKALLTKIEKTVVRDCDENIYKFEKRSGGQIDIKELPASSECAFLPSSFLAASG